MTPDNLYHLDHEDDEYAGSRFDLEQAIMACWTTGDDLELIARHVADVGAELPAPALDKIMNMLIGLKDMHDLRCSKAMDVFSEMIEAGDVY